MYVTYTDLIQIGIFIVALVGLCYTIFKGKNDSRHYCHSDGLMQIRFLFLRVAASLAFPFSILNIAYPAVGRKKF